MCWLWYDDTNRGSLVDFTTTTTLYGLKESIAHVRTVAAHEGGFDGVIAFSQGVVLAHALLAGDGARHLSQSSASRSFAAVLIGGWPCRDTRFAGSCSNVVVLSVHGARDTRIPSALGHEVAKCFDEPPAEHFEHAGAHSIPVSKTFRKTLALFLEGALTSATPSDCDGEIMMRARES
jgi:hypothetical protein